MKKLHPDDLLRRFSEVHRDTYEYSLPQEAPTTRSKIAVVCRKHGAFSQTIANHLRGAGCPSCAGKHPVYKDFAARAAKAHGGRYVYPALPPTFSSTDKLRVVCGRHGEFMQTAYVHLRGGGCPKCAGRGQYSGGEFRRLAMEKHGGRYAFDANKTEYPPKEKLVFVCEAHGEFKQTPRQHLHSAGCPTCAQEIRMERGDFIARAYAVHQGKYTYEKYSPGPAGTPVVITCPIHGEFSQARNAHLSGAGCRGCANTGNSRSKTATTAEVAARLGVDVIEYVNTESPIRLSCKVHGEYEVARAGDAIYKGVRCSQCANKVSRWEQDVGAYLTSIGVATERTRKIIAPKEIDLYSEEHRVGVECHGAYFHSTAFQTSPSQHLHKLRLAQAADIRLVQVFEDEWKYRRSAVENLLASAFGKTPRVFARSCALCPSTSKDVQGFLEQHHIQGAAKGSAVFTLTHRGEVAAVMVFSKVTSERGATDAGWELVRYASAGTVVGGASRLFTAFLRAHRPSRVISYSDRRLFSGGMYEKLGFAKLHDTRPTYTVLVGDQRKHKANFKKSLLAKRLGPEAVTGRTEQEVCKEQGWFRVYDCGVTKWEWRA